MKIFGAFLVFVLFIGIVALAGCRSGADPCTRCDEVQSAGID